MPPRKPSVEPVRQASLFPGATVDPAVLVQQMEAEMKLRKVTRERLAAELGASEAALKAWSDKTAVPGPDYQDRITGWLSRPSS